jgi:hypothetical protein
VLIAITDLFVYYKENMRLLLLVPLLYCLSSCGGSAISKKLSASDSLVITFNVPDKDSIIKTTATTDKKAIGKLSGFMNGKKAEEYKCGYDGNLSFYSKGQLLLPVIFKFTEEGCRHFLFELDNKVISTSMSNEAVDFLTGLKEGKGSY